MVLVAQPELGALALQIKQHWKKYRPRMSRELEQAGHLDESVSAAAELTSHVLHDLIFQRPDSALMDNYFELADTAAVMGS